MTEDQLLPYLAGFFDGEGCISLTYVKKDSYHKLVIAVAQNERAVLELFQARFGGTIYELKWKKAKRVFYNWMPTGRDRQKAVLTALAPFLIHKKREAEIGLAFIATAVRSRHDLDAEEKQLWFRRRGEMWEEMKDIKRSRTILGIVERKLSEEASAN